MTRRRAPQFTLRADTTVFDEGFTAFLRQRLKDALSQLSLPVEGGIADGITEMESVRIRGCIEEQFGHLGLKTVLDQNVMMVTSEEGVRGYGFFANEAYGHLGVVVRFPTHLTARAIDDQIKWTLIQALRESPEDIIERLENDFNDSSIGKINVSMDLRGSEVLVISMGCDYDGAAKDRATQHAGGFRGTRHSDTAIANL